MSEKKQILKKRKSSKKTFNERFPTTPVIRTKKEEIFNSITHGFGAIIGVVALILLVRKSTTNLELTAAIIYGISIILMMSMSSIYHAIEKESKIKNIFRKFDYLGVYLLIGGTFSPLFLICSTNPLKMILFYVQWILIILGSIFVLIYGPYRVRVLNFIIFFSIGYSAVVFIPEFFKDNLNLFYMILSGGLIYTLGMIPFAFRKRKGAHSIWHIFVLVAAILHFLGIYFYIY